MFFFFFFKNKKIDKTYGKTKQDKKKKRSYND